MLKRTALAALAAALICAAAAAAHTTSFVSNVSFDFLECTNCNGTEKGLVVQTWVAGGEVSSAKAACVPGRKVKLFAVYGGAPKRGPAPAPELLDTDRTSDNGAWSGRFTHTLLGVDHLRAKLVRKNIGPQGHKHICEGQAADYYVAPI